MRCAGAPGSTQMLLFSRDRDLAISEALGTRFSSNGHLINLGYNTGVQSNGMGFGSGAPLPGKPHVGPTISLGADYRAGRRAAPARGPRRGRWQLPVSMGGR